MAQVFDGIDEPLAAWIYSQPMFFVATAPLASEGSINCSPKGLPGTFAVINKYEVAYLDLTGSGAETIAHVKENGRIVVMFCAFDKRPRIVRLHGTARIVESGSSEFDELAKLFDDYLGARSIIRVSVERASDSCGYGVPMMEFVEERPNLPLDHNKRGAIGLDHYRKQNNSESIDGLPALT
jgi:hypothetical protein